MGGCLQRVSYADCSLLCFKRKKPTAASDSEITKQSKLLLIPQAALPRSSPPAARLEWGPNSRKSISCICLSSPLQKLSMHVLVDRMVMAWGRRCLSCGRASLSGKPSLLRDSWRRVLVSSSSSQELGFQ